MEKIQRTAKFGGGRVQFGCQRNCLNSILFKLDKHLVFLLITYIGDVS